MHTDVRVERVSCEVTKENFQKSRKIIIVAFATFLYPPIFDISIQKRISPHNINTISSTQVMRIKKNITKGILN